MAISTLPSDVLIAVFCALPLGQDRSNIALVCREWHEIAKPTLYRDVSLVDPRSVQNLAKTMKALTLGGKSVGSYIQSISIGSSAVDSYVYSATYDALQNICYDAINVHALTISGSLAFTVINIASRVSPSQLRNLSLIIDNETSLFTFEKIHIFQRLQELNVQGQYYSREVMEIFNGLKPWTLPELRQLQISAEQRWGASCSQFLTKCTFPKLEKLGYDIPVARNDGASLNLALFLQGFKALREATLHIKGPVSYAMVIAHTHASTLELIPIKPEFIRLISLSTHVIRISITTALGDIMTFWKVLDEIITRGRGVKSVQIVGDAFSWMLAPEDPATNGPRNTTFTLLPYLMRYATLLAGKGIALRDSHGKTLLDYFPRDCKI